MTPDRRGVTRLRSADPCQAGTSGTYTLELTDALADTNSTSLLIPPALGIGMRVEDLDARSTRSAGTSSRTAKLLSEDGDPSGVIIR